jgi:hypothetical protein
MVRAPVISSKSRMKGVPSAAIAAWWQWGTRAGMVALRRS